MPMINLEKLKKSKERSQTSSVFNWTPKATPAGETYTIRILPGEAKEENDFMFENKQHYIKDLPGAIMDDSGNTLAYARCTDKPSCPFCRLYNKLNASKEKSDKELARKVKVKCRAAFNIYLIDEETKKPPKDARVQVYNAPARGQNNVMTQIIDVMTDDEYGGDITDPKKGRNLRLKATQVGQFPEYKILPAKDQTPADPEMLKQRKPLEQTFPMITDENRIIDAINDIFGSGFLSYWESEENTEEEVEEVEEPEEDIEETTDISDL